MMSPDHEKAQKVIADADLRLEEVLAAVQVELKCQKTRWNAYGKYFYRNCEDILESLKPLQEEYGFIVIVQDSIEQVGDRIYVKATAGISLPESPSCVTAAAYAREPEFRKGMDESMITAAASSHARKRALGGLLAIDDQQDGDSLEHDMMDDVAIDYEKTERAYRFFKEIMDKEEIDNDCEHPDYLKVQEGYSRLTSDEKMHIDKMFGKDKPEGCKRGYKAILKELVKMKPADLEINNE